YARHSGRLPRSTSRRCWQSVAQQTKKEPCLILQESRRRTRGRTKANSSRNWCDVTAPGRSPWLPAEAESRRTYTLGGLVEGFPQLTIGFARRRMQPPSQQLCERTQHIGIPGHLRSRQGDVPMLSISPATNLVSPTQ